jgi:hypothetical protein
MRAAFAVTISAAALSASGCLLGDFDKINGDNTFLPTTGGTIGATGGAGGVASSGATHMRELIDDLEDDNLQILPGFGRSGSWSTINDGSIGSSQTLDADTISDGGRIETLPDGSSLTSNRAAHTTGQGFSFFVYIGVTLYPSNFPTAPYDASSYSGISFWARSAMPSTTVRVSIPDRNSDPEGGVCGGSAGACFDTFGATLTLSSDWTFFEFDFDELSQQGTGLQISTGLARSAIYGINWRLPAETTFDVWIDDVAFYR